MFARLDAHRDARDVGRLAERPASAPVIVGDLLGVRELLDRVAERVAEARRGAARCGGRRIGDDRVDLELGAAPDRLDDGIGQSAEDVEGLGEHLASRRSSPCAFASVAALRRDQVDHLGDRVPHSAASRSPAGRRPGSPGS